MTERAVAHIDPGAVERNCAHLKSLLGEVELCAVVKANGYGHGAVRCAEAALRGGATVLAVAAAREALGLRSAGVQVPILVMGALTAEDVRIAADVNAEIVVWDPAFVRKLPAGMRVHVKLDTGMGRLGTKDPDQAMAVAEIGSEKGQVRGLMTHFATADETGDDYFGEQLQRFQEFVPRFREAHPEAIVHAANSAAVYREPAAHFDMARCGVAIYGLDPFQQDPAERGLEPAMRLTSWVAAVRRFEAGDSAGYGRRWKAEQATWVGTIPIGYGDGWRRALTNDCNVLIAGRRHPVVGTVSMDNITVDLGPDTDVETGAEAVLIGEQGGERILCEEVARRLDTINYEVTCGLTQRVRRA